MQRMRDCEKLSPKLDVLIKVLPSVLQKPWEEEAERVWESKGIKDTKETEPSK